MKKGILITLSVIVGIIALWFMIFGGVYNGLVEREEGVTSAWAQVENVYQRRMDLVPNLVSTVKGYAAHESETLQNVVEARSKISQTNISSDAISDPSKLQAFQKMQGQLSSALGRLMVVVERYPDLKASKNFLALQSQLEGTENRISVERRRFNEAARNFNTYRRKFPNVIISNMMDFEKKAYFESDEGAQKSPQVQF
jgi:LemA protein